MLIDGDTHYWPPRMLERVTHPDKGEVAISGEWAEYVRDGKAIWDGIHEVRWNLEKRYEAMDREGFDLQVLIPDNRPLPYELDPELGRLFARAYNDTVAEDLAGHNRFIGVSWVYLPDVEEAVREVRRAVEDLGLYAVKVMGGFDDVHLDDERLWPFYEEVVRLDIPVLVHPVMAVAEINFFGQGPLKPERSAAPSLGLGLPFTYMSEIARLIFGGVLDEFPSLRLGFFEGGVGWVPFLMNWLDHSVARGHGEEPDPRQLLGEGPAKLRKKPSEYFQQLYVAAVSWESGLPETIELWPNHNVICGSDFDHGDAIATWPRTVETIKAMAALTAEDRQKVLGDNIHRFFGFDRHPERLPLRR